MEGVGEVGLKVFDGFFFIFFCSLRNDLFGRFVVKIYLGFIFRDFNSGDFFR